MRDGASNYVKKKGTKSPELILPEGTKYPIERITAVEHGEAEEV